MSEPTTTLAVIRRAICTELRMPFAKRYSNGYLTADAGGDTSTLIDTDLTQADQFWRKAWVYRVDTQETSPIVQFTAKDDTAKLEIPLSATLASIDYEIHSIWNAYEIHAAINEAIRSVQRTFLDEVIDETLIIEEDKRTYDISSLSKKPYLVHQVRLEVPASVKRGTVVSATTSTLTIENSGLLSDVDSNWKVSIYSGTGSGQIRSVTSVSGAQIDGLSSDWTTPPDSTSKYALWNPSDQIYDWYRYPSVRPSSKEFPDSLYFSQRPVDFYGMRIHLEYSAMAGTLSAEADTTVVPLTYIKYKACAILHSQRIADMSADRDLHFGEWKRYNEMANEYLVSNTPHRPDDAFWNNPDEGYKPTASDPLNWYNA